MVEVLPSWLLWVDMLMSPQLELSQQHRRSAQVQEDLAWQTGGARAGLHDSQAENNLNNSLKELVVTRVNQFKADYNDLLILFRENQEIAPSDPREYFLNIDYVNYAVTPLVFSSRLTASDYLGGAHPNSYVTAFNYSPRENRALELEDLFQEESDYKSVILDYVWEQLVNNPNTYMSVAAGTDGETTLVTKDLLRGDFDAELSRFFIDSDGLLFVFDPYQVAPYAAGIIEVKVPYSDLEDIINKNLIGGV